VSTDGKTEELPFQIAMNAITLRQLQYFVAVADEEHFTRASERFLIAQPSLSRQVRDLEDVIGVTLFVRDARGAHLTRAGHELLMHSRQILAMLERALHSVRHTSRRGGRLRLGYYGPSFYNNVVTRSALERFRSEYPDVDIIPTELFSGQMAGALESGRIDVAISRGDPSSPVIASWSIATERLHVLLSEGDELAGEARLRLADLDGRKLITFPQALASGFNTRVANIAATAGVSLIPAFEFTQLTSIAYHVSIGDGVAILAASSAAVAVCANTVSRELSDSDATCSLMVWARLGETDPLTHKFLALVGVQGQA
jgi:DNA-binding transcriptional LysR family regulator